MLTDEAKRRLAVAMADNDAAAEITGKFDALGALTAFGAGDDLATDTVGNLAADTQARIEAIEGKVNAILAIFA